MDRSPWTSSTCLVVYGSGFLLLPLAHSWWGVAVAVTVMAVGNGLGAGVNMTIGADLSPKVGRGRFLGIWRSSPTSACWVVPAWSPQSWSSPPARSRCWRLGASRWPVPRG